MKTLLLLTSLLTLTMSASAENLIISDHNNPLILLTTNEPTVFALGGNYSPTPEDPVRLDFISNSGQTEIWTMHARITINGESRWTPGVAQSWRSEHAITGDGVPNTLTIRQLPGNVEDQHISAILAIPSGDKFIANFDTWDVDLNNPEYSGREWQLYSDGVQTGQGQIGWLKPDIIPEPKTMVLVALGMTLLIFRRRR